MKVLTMVALATLAVSSAWAEDLIVDGDFGTAVPGVYQKGATSIPGWSVFGGTVTVLANHDRPYVWMGGQAGGLQQTLHTTPSQTYRVFVRMYGIHSGVLDVDFGGDMAPYPTVPPELATDMWTANWFVARGPSTQVKLRPDQDLSTEMSVQDVEVNPVHLGTIDPREFVGYYAVMDKAAKDNDVAAYSRFYTNDFGGKDAEGGTLSLADKQALAAPHQFVRENLYDLAVDGPVVHATVQTMTSDGEDNLHTWSTQSWLRTGGQWRIYYEEDFAMLKTHGYIHHDLVKDVHPPGMQTHY